MRRNIGTQTRGHALAGLLLAAILLGLATAHSQGIDLTVGGGPPLDEAALQQVYLESFDPAAVPQDMLFGSLQFGPDEDGPWTGALEGGGYQLRNDSDPAAVRYYFAGGLDSANALSVEVSGQFGEDASWAGLLYRFQPETRYYLAFVVGADRNYSLFLRDEEGLRQLAGGTSDAVRPGETNRLTIVPEGAAVRFYANGIHLAAVSEGAPPTGPAGLIAIGSGTFHFDEVASYLAAGAPQPDDQGQDPQPPEDTVTDLLSGLFVGDQLTVELEGADGTYGGRILFGDQVFPLTATGGGGQLQGTFQSQGADFPFTAVLEGDTLTFSTGSNTYLLTRDPRGIRDPFEGDFASPGLSLTLEGADGLYQGELSLGSQAFSVTAEVADDTLTGLLESPTLGSFPFAARFDGETLVLETTLLLDLIRSPTP